MDDDRNEADRLLGEDWMHPRQALLLKALRAHPEREVIMSRAHETDENGERLWSLGYLVEEGVEDPWVEVWLVPHPPDRLEDRPPIEVGSWPQKVELDELARARAIVAEHDDTPRWN